MQVGPFADERQAFGIWAYLLTSSDKLLVSAPANTYPTVPNYIMLLLGPIYCTTLTNHIMLLLGLCTVPRGG